MTQLKKANVRWSLKTSTEVGAGEGFPSYSSSHFHFPAGEGEPRSTTAAVAILRNRRSLAAGSQERAEGLWGEQGLGPLECRGAQHQAGVAAPAVANRPTEEVHPSIAASAAAVVDFEEWKDLRFLEGAAPTTLLRHDPSSRRLRDPSTAQEVHSWHQEDPIVLVASEAADCCSVQDRAAVLLGLLFPCPVVLHRWLSLDLAGDQTVPSCRDSCVRLLHLLLPWEPVLRPAQPSKTCTAIEHDLENDLADRKLNGLSGSYYLFIDFVSGSPFIVVGSWCATILGDMAGSTTVIADDGVGYVGLIRTLPSFMCRSPAVRAARAEFTLAERAVQHCQLAELHFTQVVLVFGHFHCFFDDLFDLKREKPDVMI